MEKYFYIPNIKLIGYGRCQTYQISCLKCGKLTFSLDKLRSVDELFCEDCDPDEKYIKERNISSENYVGNIIGIIIKSTTDSTLKKRSFYNYKKVYKRDKYTCQYCGYNLEEYTEFRALHIDHIKPWSAGGSNKMNNLSVSCSKCNLTLSDKWFNTFEEKKAYLLNINENKRIMRRKPYLMI